MLHGDIKVLVALAETDGFVLLFEIVDLSSVVFVLKTALNSLKWLDLLCELRILIFLFLDALCPFFNMKVHLLDHLLISLNLRDKLVSSITFFQLDFFVEVLLLKFKGIFLRFEGFLTIINVVDLLLNLNYLIVELLVHGLIFCLLLLGFLKLQ
jgi:hypothetical protein